MSFNANDEEDRKSYEKVGRIYNQVTGYINYAVVEKLLQTEVDINRPISNNSRRVLNLLHVASRDPKLFDLLLSYGADFTCKDDEGKTVVHKIIQKKVDDRTKPLCQETFRDECIDLILTAHVKFNNPSNPCDENGISHFHAACMTNNAPAVEFFLKNGVVVDQAVNADSPIFPAYTPLHFAANYTCPDAVEILSNYGANICLKNAEGLNPLHLIVRRKIANCEITATPRFVTTLNILIKYFIDNDIGHDSIDDCGFCKLHVACLLEDQYIVKNVLNRLNNVNQAVNFNSPICSGFTALHFAAFSSVQVFKLLLKRGANIDIKNTSQETPFDLCLKHYTIEDIHSILVSKKEWKCILLSDRETRLIDIVSALQNFDEMISFLNRMESALLLYVPLDSPLWPGYTLLHLAVIFTEKARFLEDMNHRTLYENTIIDECLKRGADMTVVDARGSTALHLTFYMGKHRVMEYLLNHYDKTSNPTDKNNLSYFHIACLAHHVRAVEHFLSSGFDVNSSVLSTFECTVLTNHANYTCRPFFIYSGSTALHLNVASGNVTITKMLLKHGADVHVQDASGFTPVHRLLSNETFPPSKEIIDAILSVKNLKNSNTHCGLSHLHVACYFGHYSAIKKLLKVGANVNAPNYNHECELRVDNSSQFLFDTYGNRHKPFSFLSKYAGYTPLHFSCHKKNYKATLLLIKRGADVFAKNAKGISPMEHLLCNIDTCDEYYQVLSEITSIQMHLQYENFGITKLHLACHLADLKLVRTMISRGANVNAKVHSNSPIWQGRTPLHITVKRAFEKYKDKNVLNKLKKNLRLLLKHGADPLLVDDNNDTPFHIIRPVDYYRRKDRLLKVIPFIHILFDKLRDFIVNSNNFHGFSLFHLACVAGKAAVIEKFLKHGVNVNSAISYFSEDCPGSTPLHLIVVCADFSKHRSSRKCKSSTIKLSRTVDLLLQNGANINATDGFGNTPLHVVSLLEASRDLFVEQFIRRILNDFSNGADIHALNVRGNTPLGSFMFSYTPDTKDIEVFLKHGCDINMYNPISQQGYIGIRNINKVIQTQRMLDINSMGRTVLHNVVSNEAKKFHDYGLLIELITARGRDIDHKDNEGKTALHLAVSFKNGGAVLELLKDGADINVTDKNGKTAFAYCIGTTVPNNYTCRVDGALVMDVLNPNYVMTPLAQHVCELEFCGQYVNEQNKRFRDQVLEIWPFSEKKFDRFHFEIEKIKNIKISTIFSSLYEFFMNTDADIVYMNMTNEERREIDEFFENIRSRGYCRITGLLKLKYRQTTKRTRLLEPALVSLNEIIKSQLLELCCRHILKFLQNEDLKRLIASVT